jgi:hypothetical protein
MRDEYQARSKHHLVGYVETLIREVDVEIETIRLAAPGPTPS